MMLSGAVSLRALTPNSEILCQDLHSHAGFDVIDPF